MLYHGTNKEIGVKIWNEGLKTDASINNHRKHRKSIRKHVDKIASRQYENYVPRENAIFAWPTFESAAKYASRYTEPAIVEFDLDGPAWCVESHVAEDLYQSYNENFTDEDIFYVISHYRPWNNVRVNDLEVWFQESSVNDIYRIVDDYGEPL